MKAWEESLHTPVSLHPAKRLPARKAGWRLERARMLRTLQTQIDTYRVEIEKLLARHPDSGLFGSLPGAGPKIAPRLLGEIGSDRPRFEDPIPILCLAVTAPVSYQSGQIHKVYLRRHCNKALRHAVHLWENLSRQSCPWAAVYYQQLRERGKSHACAAMPRPALAQDPLENVADSHLIRRRTPRS
jgi:transposase